MPTGGFGPASAFIRRAYATGMGADELHKQLNAGGYDYRRAYVRNAYDALEAEGVTRTRLATQRPNTPVAVSNMYDANPNQPDRYRYNLAVSIESTKIRPDGTITTEHNLVYRSYGSNERLSKDQAIQGFISQESDRYASSDVKIRGAVVEGVYYNVEADIE